MEQKVKLFLIFMIVFAVTVPGLSFAQQSPTPSSTIGNFINSAERVGLEWLSPRTIFNKIDNWFYDTTGTRLVIILKPVGNLFVWLFSMLADLIKWGLALI